MAKCWIITEGLAGTENQCIGVAEALGLMPVIKRIGLRQPWKSLSPWLAFEQSWSFTGDRIQPTQKEEWPELVLTSGRKAIAAARYVKKHSHGKSFIAHIQDPRFKGRFFDLIAIPAHDPGHGDKVIKTIATPNRITPAKLADAKKEFAPTLTALPTPKVAVLIGGNSKAYKITEKIVRELISQLTALADQGYGLMITASRRTGSENIRLLKKHLQHENIYFWDGTGENPYFGFLGWADFILVTQDSTSMISEAASTGTPVYVIPLEGGAKRLNLFHKGLIDRQIIRDFSGNLETYSYTPLNDAAAIAEAIKEKLLQKKSV